MSDERGSMVGVGAMDEEESLEVCEGGDRDIGGTDGVRAFAPRYAYAHMSTLNHGHIVGAIT